MDGCRMSISGNVVCESRPIIDWHQLSSAPVTCINLTAINRKCPRLYKYSRFDFPSSLVFPLTGNRRIDHVFRTAARDTRRRSCWPCRFWWNAFGLFGIWWEQVNLHNDCELIANDCQALLWYCMFNSFKYFGDDQNVVVASFGASLSTRVHFFRWRLWLSSAKLNLRSWYTSLIDCTLLAQRRTLLLTRGCGPM